MIFGREYMKRVLCIVGSMDAGGAETFLMKIYRKLDKAKYQMDFCVTKLGFYDEEIKELGGNIYFTVPKTKNPIASFISIRKIVSENNYKYVMRVSQNSLSSVELLAAKLGGAERTVYRSSNSQVCGGALERLIHRLFIPFSKHFSDLKIAPSTESAEFMFGKGCINEGRALILHNAIDLDVYKYDEKKRAEIRKQFGITEKYVIGTIGRFNKQKNHSFLLNVFKYIYCDNPNAVLVLVGSGELEYSIKEKCKMLNIENNVIMTGIRKDIPALLSAMDIFVLPSLFEGLPNTVIEAQAIGLPCILSDTITKEVKVTNLVTYLSLSQPVAEWAKCIASKNGCERVNTRPIFEEKQYDIQSTIEKFEKIVFS